MEPAHADNQRIARPAKPRLSHQGPSAPELPAVTLPGTDLVTSPLGFGCADLFREPSGPRRRRILDAARADGICHFDVAPMYGLGLAERELASFARHRRDQLVIATKFGIAPTAAAQALARVQRPVRRLFSRFPALRERARSSAAGPRSGRSGSALYRAIGFDAAAARASLECSLRELETDYIDLLLLHDPQPGGVQSDGLCEYLEQARTAGLIRAWGVAGERDPTRRVVEELPAKPPVLQVRHDLLEPSASGQWAASFPARIVFGILGRSIARIVHHVTSEPERRHAWRERVGRDCGDPEVVAALLLRQAARENPEGVVLFSTIRTEHVRSAVQAIADPPRGDAEELDAFMALLNAQLRTGSAGAEAVP
jgi:D-threo-aldose 1-dehydrogenase